MTPEIVYLLKVNIAFALFYGFYRLFFYKDTFFKLRRVFLLAFYGLALLYPLCNFQDWLKGQEPMAEVIGFYSAIISPVIIETEASEPVSWANIWLCLYLLGAALLLIRLIAQLYSILHLKRQSRLMVYQGVWIYALEHPAGPFSFFHLIFIYLPSLSEKEIDEILTHESTHVRQMHSIDVIASEILTILFWYNPFVWLLKREVRHNLEYLADDRVLHSGYDSKSYQYHLLGLAHHQAAATLYNSFNVLHLKNRISMMNKKRSKGIIRIKYLVFLPLIGFLLLFSNIEAVARVTKGLVKEFTRTELPQAKFDEPPLYPGGEQALQRYIQMNLRYPSDAAKQEIQGQVVIEYTIATDGSVTDVKPQTNLHPLLDNEVIRVVKEMGKWTPAKNQGTPVAVKRTLPVLYRLNGAKKQLETAGVEGSIVVVGYATKEEEKPEMVHITVTDLPEKESATEPFGKVDVKVVEQGKVVTEDNEVPYTGVEEMPSFPGGDNALMDYIHTNLQYPKESKVNGRVIVRFIVQKDGSVSNVEVLRGLDPACDAAALMAVRNMPKWTPGKQKGKPVPVYFTVPISFRNSLVEVKAKTNDEVEQMPQYPGGDKALMAYVTTNLKYPRASAEAGTQGRVIIRYVVQTDGSLSNIEVLRGLDPACDAEAIRIVESMPKWIPGKNKGKPVPVYFTLPIQYRLQ